ncbi:hypothetical protein ACE6H2_021858 [Prunus campanulata]
MEASAMTIAVAAASESEKHETAKGLQSGQHSSLCEWFICDDYSTFTLCFVVQGTNVLVHRGIFEGAKGIYQQFMPEILDHLKRNGEQAKFQFTGHCIGGSIALSVLRAFLNSPHPLETISDPAAYGSEGRVLHDHDSCNYLKTMNVVLRATYKDDCEESEESLVANAYFTISTLME